MPKSPSDDRWSPALLDPLEKSAGADRDVALLVEVEPCFVILGVDFVDGETVVVDQGNLDVGADVFENYGHWHASFAILETKAW
jgi:hypothetical protein